MTVRILLFVLALGLAACGGPRPASDAPAEVPALLDVWGGFDASFAGLAQQDTPCDVSFGTWFEEFGVRGVACVVAGVLEPTALVRRAGVAPFVGGPHTAAAEAFALDLQSTREFGRYDPAFVRWMIENGVVGENRPAVRTLTQPVYDRHLRRLARIYWLTHADMAADGFPEHTPAGILSDYADFLGGGPVPGGAYSPDGGFSVFAFTELSEGLLPRIGLDLQNEWEAKYEANTAFGFWLRRREDRTLGLWHDGLRRLLAAYDAQWFALHR